MGIGPPYLNSGDGADKAHEAAFWITSALSERLSGVMDGGSHFTQLLGFFGTSAPTLEQWKAVRWDQVGSLFDYKRGGIQYLIEICIKTVASPWGATNWIWDDDVWWNGSRAGSEYDLGQSTILDNPPAPYFGGPEYNLYYNLTMANPYLAPPGYHTGQEISVLNPFPPAYGWWDVTKFIDKETIAPGKKARYSIPRTAAFFNQMMWFLDQLQDWVWWGKWDFSPNNSNPGNMGNVPYTWTRSVVGPSSGIPWTADARWAAHISNPLETYTNNVPGGFIIEQEYYFGTLPPASGITTTRTTEFPFAATKRLPVNVRGNVERTRCYTQVTGNVSRGSSIFNPFDISIGAETYHCIRRPNTLILDVSNPPAGSKGYNNLNIEVEGITVDFAMAYPSESILEDIGSWFRFECIPGDPATYITGNLQYAS